MLEPGAERADGQVQRETALHTLAIPSTALTSNQRGELCAWVPAETGYRAVPVTALSSRAGVTNVSGDLPADGRVLANPSDVLADATCP